MKDEYSILVDNGTYKVFVKRWKIHKIEDGKIMYTKKSEDIEYKSGSLQDCYVFIQLLKDGVNFS